MSWIARGDFSGRGVPEPTPNNDKPEPTPTPEPTTDPKGDDS